LAWIADMADTGKVEQESGQKNIIRVWCIKRFF